jgi:pentatricopeptide repeat protein
MIRAYVKNENYERAFELYHQMQRLGVEPDKFTFPLVLKACAGLSALQEGREIHYQIDRCGLDYDIFVVTALMDMYAKCGSIDSARQVFDKMSGRDVVSWNAMIAGYCQNGRPDEALVLFYWMQATGIKSNSVTMGMHKMDTGMRH